MPNEIYHRSNWGESKAEDFGDVYYDHAATNKLYNHSDYYENSDGTDATLKDLNNKASIVLTPTAYSDGSLNTVIPTDGNGDFDFSRGSSATRVNEQGLVEDVQILSGELVQNGNFEQIGSELVTNGDFDDGLNGWSSHSGSILELEDGKAKVTTVGSQGFIKRTDLTIQSGKIYFCTVQITNATIPQFYINGTSNVLNPIPLISGNTYGGYITTTGTNSTFYIRGNNVNGQVSFIDNVSVKEVGQNWSFGTGWSMGDGKAIGDGTMVSNVLEQDYDFIDGSLYRFTFTIKDYVSGSVFIRQPFDGSSDAVSANGTYSFDYVASSTNALKFRGNSFIGSIDDVSFKLVTDDTDLPRIDYTDGTGSLLLEPQRTNLITYSEDFSQWATSGTITVESGYLAPDGSTNAYKITDGAPSNNATALFLVGVAAADNARTIWAKTVSGTGTANLCSHNSNTNNLFTVTNEWQRFEVNSATGTGTPNFYGVDFRDSGTLTEILIWGAQTEVGDYATSYIPTSGSTVTRSADVANNSGNADLFNDSEGVLYAEIAALADDGTARRMSISDSTTSNRVVLMYHSTSNVVRGFVSSGGSLVSDMTYTVSDTTQVSKIAFSYKQDDFKIFIDGVQRTTDDSGNTPTGLKELAFDGGSGSNDFYGDVKSVAVFKEALSNDLLERLTGEGYESFRLLAEANNYTII